MLLWAVCITQALTVVYGYSQGPPASSCGTMLPSHGGVGPSSSAYPYTIQVNPTTYTAGSNVTVRIFSSDGFTPYLGYFLQARLPNTFLGPTEYFGSFSRITGSRLLCQGRAISHRNNNPKFDKTFIWKAPSVAVGDVEFRMTLVLDYSTYWVDLKSEIIRELIPTRGTPTIPTTKQSPTSITTPPGSSSTTAATTRFNPPTQATATRPASIPRFSKDSLCGKVKGCFHDCDLSGCTSILSWLDIGDKIEFELTMTLPLGGEKWMAIAFSNDTRMGSDSVVECIENAGRIDILHSYNEGKSNIPAARPNLGLSNRAGSHSNGIMKCRFLHDKNVTGYDYIANLNKTWHIFIAHGEGSAGFKLPHSFVASELPLVSPKEISFQSLEDIAIFPGIISGVPVPFKMTMNDECGVTIGCFHYCNDVDCEFMVTWKDAGSHVDFDLKAKIHLSAFGDHWIALGFSKDQLMGDDSVIECKSINHVVKVLHSYNEGYNSFVLQNETIGLSNGVGIMLDAAISCSFRREKVVPGESRVFDLNQEWYILVATGDAITGIKLPHSSIPGELPFISATKINFLGTDVYNYTESLITTTTFDIPTTTFFETTTTRPVTNPTTNKPVPKSDSNTTTVAVSATTNLRTTKFTTRGTNGPAADNILPDTECGTVKGCYQSCSVGSCSFLISWVDGAGDITFHLAAEAFGQPSVNKWIAIGFSGDTRMGNDSVIECITNEGIIDVYHSFNEGHNNVPLGNNQQGLSQVSGSYIGGVVRCSFTRIKTIPGRQAELFDLSKDWHIIFARGDVSNKGEKLPHSFVSMQLPMVSVQPVDLQAISLASGAANRYPLVKLHACVMIIAWVVTATIGVVAARYFKVVWPESKPCGKPVWFQLHRGCMLATFILVVIGFVVIFVEINGYSEIPVTPGKSYLPAHPVLGIIVMILTVLNPLMSLFRCAPDDKNRPLFNWVHWGVGTTAHVFAVLTIFFGFQLAKSHVAMSATYVMAFYVGYHLLVMVILEVHQCSTLKKEIEAPQKFEMGVRRSTKPDSHYPMQENPPMNHSFKISIFLVHVFVVSVLAIILMAIVIVS